MTVITEFILALIPAVIALALMAILDGVFILLFGKDELPSWVGENDSPYDLDHGHYRESGWFGGYEDTEKEEEEEEKGRYQGWDVCSAPRTKYTKRVERK